MLVFFPPQGGKRGEFLARVMKPLLHGAEENRVRADLQENVMPVFDQALKRG